MKLNNHKREHHHIARMARTLHVVFARLHWITRSACLNVEGRRAYTTITIIPTMQSFSLTHLSHTTRRDAIVRGLSTMMNGSRNAGKNPKEHLHDWDICSSTFTLSRMHETHRDLIYSNKATNIQHEKRNFQAIIRATSTATLSTGKQHVKTYDSGKTNTAENVHTPWMTCDSG